MPNAIILVNLDGVSGISDGWYGSAIVSASNGGKLAVIADTYIGADGLQTLNALPAETAGTDWRIPQFLSWVTSGGRYIITAVSVQNLSSSQIGVGGVTLACTGQQSVTNNATIPINGQYTFNPKVDGRFTSGWAAPCRLTSGSANVVASVINRYFQITSPFSPLPNMSAHEAIRGNSPNKQAIFPLIIKRLSNGEATGVTIQNLSLSSNANMTFTYLPAPDCSGCGSHTIYANNVPPQGSVTHNHRCTDLCLQPPITDWPDNWWGTLKVTSDQPIGGYISYTNTNNPAGDTLMAHVASARP